MNQENKKGIDYSKDNIYDAIGRPELKPKNNIDKILEEFREYKFNHKQHFGRNYSIEPTIDFFRDKLNQIRQETIKECIDNLPNKMELENIMNMRKKIRTIYSDNDIKKGWNDYHKQVHDQLNKLK